MNITYNDQKKDLPVDQLRRLFYSVGWMESLADEPEERLKGFMQPYMSSLSRLFLSLRRNPLSISWNTPVKIQSERSITMPLEPGTPLNAGAFPKIVSLDPV